MSASNSTADTTHKMSHDTVFDAWLTHNSATHRRTAITVHELLRKAYPGCEVVRTDPEKCNLLGFAKAGHASFEPIVEPTSNLARVYSPPKTRLVTGGGKLKDEVSFGRWTFTWSGSEFTVYKATYRNTWDREVDILFVLTQAASDKADQREAVDRLLFAAGEWTSDVHEEIWVFEDEEWTKDESLWQGVQDTTWDNIIINPKTRQALEQDVNTFFDNRALYRKLGVPWKRGIIFHGDPGNGKTLFIKMLINSLAKRPDSIPTLYVKSLDACRGPKWSIQQIFHKAREVAPCLLVLEDLDSLVTDKTRSFFLNEADGLAENDGISMLGSTNHLDRLDTAVTKRPSRFDRKYHFAAPSYDARLKYCHYWKSKFGQADLVDFPEEICDVVAHWTKSLSFAYMKELFVSSLLILLSDGVEEIALNGHAEEDHDAANVNGKQGTNVDLQGGGRDKDKAKKVSLPDIAIPDSLHNNRLLSIIKAQAQSLLEDKEDTLEKDEEKERKKKKESEEDSDCE